MRISDWSSDVCSSDLFRLMAGEALGIVGASGSGKSTLVRALTGIWPPVQGRVRLDGAAMDHYPPEVRGRTIGYLPQTVEVMDGAVAETLASFSHGATMGDVTAEGRAAEELGLTVG